MGKGNSGLYKKRKYLIDKGVTIVLAQLKEKL